MEVRHKRTGQTDVTGLCPIRNAPCTTDCMLFLVASKAVVEPITVGEGSCAFSILASHVASEEHSGGNYLMKVASVPGE